MSNLIIRVNDNSDDVMRAVNEKIKLALSLMGDTIEGYAKEDCPVDTGLLRNSLTHGPGGGAPKIRSYKADNPREGQPSSGTYPSEINGESDCEFVGSNVEYAPDVEFINRYHQTGKAHFLRDAGQDHINELKSIAQTTLSTI